MLVFAKKCKAPPFLKGRLSGIFDEAKKHLCLQESIKMSQFHGHLEEYVLESARLTLCFNF
jgi:hypothetical protein